MPHLDINTQNIVFFDGVCNLCNGAVNTLIDLDTRHNLLFAQLQGETYKQYSSKPLQETSDFSTIIFVQQGRESAKLYTKLDTKCYTKSDAAIRIVACLGGAYWISLGLLIIPRFLRNTAYDFVARHRYRWFGKSETCRIPTPKLLARFLP